MTKQKHGKSTAASTRARIMQILSRPGDLSADAERELLEILGIRNTRLI